MIGSLIKWWSRPTPAEHEQQGYDFAKKHIAAGKSVEELENFTDTADTFHSRTAFDNGIDRFLRELADGHHA